MARFELQCKGGFKPDSYALRTTHTLPCFNLSAFFINLRVNENKRIITEKVGLKVEGKWKGRITRHLWLRKTVRPPYQHIPLIQVVRSSRGTRTNTRGHLEKDR